MCVSIKILYLNSLLQEDNSNSKRDQPDSTRKKTLSKGKKKRGKKKERKKKKEDEKREAAQLVFFLSRSYDGRLFVGRCKGLRCVRYHDSVTISLLELVFLPLVEWYGLVSYHTSVDVTTVNSHLVDASLLRTLR